MESQPGCVAALEGDRGHSCAVLRAGAFWLVWIYAGFRGMLEVWPALLVAGGTFGLTQLLMGAFVGPGLVDIAASTATMFVLVVFFRFWKPKRVLNAVGKDITAQQRSRSGMGLERLSRRGCRGSR